MTKIDVSATLEQVEGYVGLLTAFGASLQSSATDDTGVTWYLTYNNSLVVVGYDLAYSFIMYHPEQLTFEYVD